MRIILSDYQQKGFSLLELSLVLGIIAVLLSGVLFAYADYSNHQKLAATAEQHISIVSKLKQYGRIIPQRGAMNTAEEKDFLTRLNVLPGNIAIAASSAPDRYHVALGEIKIDLSNAKIFKIIHYLPADTANCTKFFLALNYTDSQHMAEAGVLPFDNSGQGAGSDFDRDAITGPIQLISTCEQILTTATNDEIAIGLAYHY